MGGINISSELNMRELNTIVYDIVTSSSFLLSSNTFIYLFTILLLVITSLEVQYTQQNAINAQTTAALDIFNVSRRQQKFVFQTIYLFY